MTQEDDAAIGKLVKDYRDNEANRADLAREIGKTKTDFSFFLRKLDKVDNAEISIEEESWNTMDLTRLRSMITDFNAAIRDKQAMEKRLQDAGLDFIIAKPKQRPGMRQG